MSLFFSIKFLVPPPKKDNDIITQLYSAISTDIVDENTGSTYSTMNIYRYKSKKDTFHVVYETDTIYIGCGTFSTEREAFSALSTHMKKVMKGEILIL